MSNRTQEKARAEIRHQSVIDISDALSSQECKQAFLRLLVWLSRDSRRDFRKIARSTGGERNSITSYDNWSRGLGLSAISEKKARKLIDVSGLTIESKMFLLAIVERLFDPEISDSQPSLDIPEEAPSIEESRELRDLNNRIELLEKQTKDQESRLLDYQARFERLDTCVDRLVSAFQTLRARIKWLGQTED